MKRQSPEDEFNAEIKKQRLSRVNPPVWTTSHGMSMMPIMHTPPKDSKIGTSPELKTKNHLRPQSRQDGIHLTNTANPMNYNLSQWKLNPKASLHTT